MAEPGGPRPSLSSADPAARFPGHRIGSPTADHLGANLAGTRSLAALIDSSAREGAGEARVDFAKATADALPELWAADLAVTVVTMQGPILLADYLATRCVEAVVHGMDIVEPTEPDPVARDIAAEALIEVLAHAGTRPGARCTGAPPVGMDRRCHRPSAGPEPAGRGGTRDDMKGRRSRGRRWERRMSFRTVQPMQNSLPSGSSITVQLVPLPWRSSIFLAPRATSRCDFNPRVP